VPESSQINSLTAAGYVTFVFAGADAVGDYVCSECNYGVSVQQRLPFCPMCGGEAWEPVVRPGLQLQ
jgi:rubrerythrin